VETKVRLEGHEPKSRFWFFWVLALVVTGLAIVLPTVLIAQWPDDMFEGDNYIGPIVACGLGILVVDVILGIGQSLALQGLFGNAIKGQWFLPTFLGLLGSFFYVGIISGYAREFAAAIPAGAFLVALFAAVSAGALFAAVQWASLRQFVSDSRWWILVNGGCWGMIVLLIKLADVIFMPRPVSDADTAGQLYAFPFRPLGMLPYWSAAFMLGIILYGIITAAVLTRLPRH
jgi:hypothetical protein